MTTKHIIIGLTIFLGAIFVSIFVSRSNSNSNRDSRSDNSVRNDTLRIGLDAELNHGVGLGTFAIALDQQFFNTVKTEEYFKVYVFQSKKRDEYGNYYLDDKIICDDLSNDEFNEIKKYADFDYYYLHCDRNKIKYNFKPMD